MDQHSIDILEIFLKKQELNYHEVESDIESGKKWKNLTSDSIRVTVAKKLRELASSGGFLVRRELGHKNVRYAFRNEKAREKASLLIHPTAVEWNRTMSTILNRMKRAHPDSPDFSDALEETIFILPGALLSSYLFRIADAIVRNDDNDVTFYREQAQRTLSSFWEALIRALRQKDLREQLRRCVETEKKLGGMDLLPTNELELLAFFEKRFKG
jgi:hypothetical protein